MIIVVSIILGILIDLCELINLHKLKLSGILFGTICGIVASLLILMYPPILIFVCGVLLYWIVNKKIGDTSFAIATALVLITSGYEISKGVPNLYLIVVFLIAYQIINYVNHLFKDKHQKTLLIRHYIPTIILWILTGDFMYIVINLSITLGTMVSDWLFNRKAQ